MQSVHRSSRAAIETLESRTFLSASPVIHPTAVHATPAVKARPTLPALTSRTYSYILPSGDTELILLFSTESKAGALHGAVIIGTAGDTNTEYLATGIITRARKLTLHGKIKKLGVTVTGTVSADLSTITGKFATTGAKKNLHVPFNATFFFNEP